MVRRVVRAATVLAIVAIGLVAAAPPAAACSCASGTDDEKLEHADVAFTGELVGVRNAYGDEGWSYTDPMRWVFEVDRVFKGEAKSTQSVVTPQQGGSCGFEISGRGPFLVFATTGDYFELEKEPGELSSSLCSGTRAMAEAPVPASFGEGSTPDAGASPIGSPGDDGLPMAVVVAAGGLVLLILLVVASLVRRARRERSLAIPG